MADEKENLSYDAEKGAQISGRELSSEPGIVQHGSVQDIALGGERHETTKRGLKSRHAQMIALGGTIGTGYVRPLCIFTYD